MKRIVAFILAFVAVPAVYGLDLRPRFDPLARRLLEEGAAVGFVVGIVLANTANRRITTFGESITRIAAEDQTLND
jgi:hypothetical protein